MAMSVLAAFLLLASSAEVCLSTADDRVEAPLVVAMERLGTIRPRAASEIADSNWTVGCEALDRDRQDFEEYKGYLEPLGIKTIRLQAGWAKTEKVKGRLDFAWLDRIVLWAVDHGLNVLLETDYGNPVYGAGGGDIWLGSPFPSSPEALAAWDRWVDELSKRYRGKVRDWAMWNEPDLDAVHLPKGAPLKHAPHTPEMIVAQNVRTARIIRRNIPDARIGALSLASNRPEFLEPCLKAMGADSKLFTWIIYHGYIWNPDVSYSRIEGMRALVAKYAPHLRLRQGENGCNAGWVPTSAISKYSWSEYSQAKWNIRRMLGDLGHDIPSSVFSIAAGGEGKGLLRTAGKKVLYARRAYYSVQNVAAVFDSSLVRKERVTLVNNDPRLAIYEYRKRGTGGVPLYVFWDHDELDRFDGKTNRQCPSDSFVTRPTVFIQTGTPLRDPVWADLLTGRVYAFPKKNVHAMPDGRTLYRDVPVYDSPTVLTERSVLLP